MDLTTDESVHVVNDDRRTFDRDGYATRTRCGIRFRRHPKTSAVWPHDKKQGYVVAMGKHLRIPRKTKWCAECLAGQPSGKEER